MPPITRDVVLLVLGAVFILLGLIGNIGIREFILQVSKIQRGVMLVIGVILLSSGILSDRLFPAAVAERVSVVSPQEATKLPQPPADPPGNEPGVSVTQPANSDIVGGEAEVSGSYDPSVTDDIWVIVWPEKAPGRGWPQSDDGRQGLPCAKRDGKWTVHCYFGGPAQSYRIAVYTATPSATDIISTTLKDWYKKNDYKGFSRANLPNGLKEHKDITVRKGA